MSELILELYTEEIPALMQRPAEEEYKRIFAKKLLDNGIEYSLLEIYIGPRRVTIHIDGLPAKLPAKNIELKGPRVGSPDAAIEGFCKANNISKNDLVVKNIGTQECYFYEHTTKERLIEEIFPQILTSSIAEYSWPKSMYWGSYNIKWVRPLLNIMCILDGKILPLEYGHLRSNSFSFGHRFIANEKFIVENWQDYLSKLKNSFVVLSRGERTSLIKTGIESIEKKHNLTVEIDPRLLEEVSGLVEHISVLIGKIPEKFMHLPSEILVTSMRTHQRYFPTRFKDGKFAPYFVFVSNLPGGDLSEVVSGNEKVLSARLADAAYFYSQDKKYKLEDRVEDLKSVLFHAKLGTIYDKSQRLVAIADLLQSGNKNLARAALLCKADLVTEAVGEFPELQGIMGSYYAIESGEEKEVADAIRSHYKPLGNDDDMPTGTAAYLALADKIDSLVGLMLAGERATGSKDPYALRRYALSIIKIIVDNNLEGIGLKYLVSDVMELYPSTLEDVAVGEAVYRFIEERLKHLVASSYSDGLINAAIDLSLEDDLVITIEKLKILDNLMKSSDGEILLQLYRRVANILGDEKISANIDESKFKLPEEKELYSAIRSILPEIESSLKSKDSSSALSNLCSLNNPISKFFDNVMVNDTDAAIANNRKAILKLVADLFGKIAHFERMG
jgi:glycyl-tRNA synthetase beta chain